MANIKVQKSKKKNDTLKSYVGKALLGICANALNMRRMANQQAVDALKMVLTEVCKDKEMPCTIEFSENEVANKCNPISVCVNGESEYYDMEVEKVVVRDIEHFDFDLVGNVDEYPCSNVFYSDTIEDGDEVELAANIIRCKLYDGNI